jgi:hypothetical protein
VISSEALFNYSRALDEEARKPAPPDIVFLRQWLANCLKAIADATLFVELLRKNGTISEADWLLAQSRLVERTTKERQVGKMVDESKINGPDSGTGAQNLPGEPIIEAAVAVCPACQAKVNEVHRADCPVAAYLRQTGYVNPDVGALQRAVMATPNPQEIPRCPECGVGGGHSTNCSVVKNMARTQGLVPEEMQ